MTEIKSLQEFFSDTETRPYFSRRPVNIPGDYRTTWRLAMVCILLHRGRANTLSMPHLHVLWWAANSSTSRELFLRWLAGTRAPDELLVRFDPSLIISVNLAIGERLAARENNGNIRLTSAGESFASAVERNDETLVAEKNFLDQLPRRITQQQIRDLLEWR